MRVICTICAETVTSDFAATPCGHTFHYTCVSQWVAPNKTCPTCRERCLLKNLVKLFVDSCELHSIDLEDVTPQELKDKVSTQSDLLKHKDQALEEARASLEEVRADMQAWQAQYDSTHRKLRNEQAACSTLKKQLSLMQQECDRTRTAQKEAEKAKAELVTLKGVETMLRGSKEEVEGLVNNYTSPSQLATFVIAMKRDYESLKQRKSTLQKEKDKLAQEVSHLKKQLRSKECEVKDYQEKLSSAEGDVLHSEQENGNLRKKVEFLLKAVESPGSKGSLKRILESPMPMKEISNSVPPADLGASPLLTTHQNLKYGTEVAIKPHIENITLSEIGTKRGLSNSYAEVLAPVNKLCKRGSSSETVASGFNGLGGQSHFLISKPGKQQKQPSLALSKGLKFAPRFRPPGKGPAKSSHVQPKLFFGNK